MTYPKQVPARSINKQSHWELVAGLVAWYGDKARKMQKPLLRIDESTVICHEAAEEASAKSSDSEQTVVYRQGEEGPLGVPSGLVFIRFSKGTSIREYEAPLKDAGFAIEKAAVEQEAAAGWVKHISGSRSETLGQLQSLLDLPDAVVVEPQMLMPRQSKAMF